jgi:DNA repair protein RadD
MHEKEASQRAILAAQPEEAPVNDVWVNRHAKPGKPDSICVTYRCGLLTVREWVCLDHDGYAGQKARQWWSHRFGEPIPTTESALQNLFLAQHLKDMTETVTFRQSGKFREIVGHKLNRKVLVG